MSCLPKFYLYKRTNGFYYIGYFLDGHLKWKSSGARLKSEALKAIIEFKRQLLKNPFIRAILSLKWILWLLLTGNYSPRTVEVYKRSLTLFESIIDDGLLSTITQCMHVDLYKMKRLGVNSQP